MENVRVLIIGHLGNMGKRYAAICDHLGIPWVGHDIKDQNPDVMKSHIIVATPTDDHFTTLLRLEHEDFGKPILCEKPIRKGLKFIRDLDTPGLANLYMVNNYAHITKSRQELVKRCRKLDTHYSYYNTGGDGIYWDCIQLIHLAKGSLKLNNTEPVWSCRINGTTINRADVDAGYVEMIKDFVGPRNNMWGYADIALAHKKVEALARTNSLSCESLPSLIETTSQS
jgi:hypothetical protein